MKITIQKITWKTLHISVVETTIYIFQYYPGRNLKNPKEQGRNAYNSIAQTEMI